MSRNSILYTIIDNEKVKKVDKFKDLDWFITEQLDLNMEINTRFEYAKTAFII